MKQSLDKLSDLAKPAKTKKLNPKQELFIQEYLKDFNATQAAIRAGYSTKTAYSQGQRLLKHVEAGGLIKQAKEERIERVKMDADNVLRLLEDIVYADISDILDDVGKYKPVKEWPKVWRQMISGMDVEQLFDGHGKERERIGEVVKIRFTDRLKSIELTGKHTSVMAFKEQIEHTGTITLADRIAKARNR